MLKTLALLCAFASVVTVPACAGQSASDGYQGSRTTVTDGGAATTAAPVQGVMVPSDTARLPGPGSPATTTGTAGGRVNTGGASPAGGGMP